MREQKTASGIEDDDTEITLGMGKLLGLFFGLVILCGLSLGIGYSLGRNAATKAAIPVADAAGLASPAAQTSAAKPTASQAAEQPAQQTASPAQQPPAQGTVKTPDCPSGENCPPQPAASSSTTDLTFYQSVQQKNSHPQLTPQQTASPAPAPRAQAAGTLGSGYLVQIAAVRNQADAKLLSDALQKQHYPVLIAQPGDNLFHVQVGPYADVKEAEAIRSRLVSSGYNAFLKR